MLKFFMRVSESFVSFGRAREFEREMYTGWQLAIYVRKGFPRVVPRLSLLFARETLKKLSSTLVGLININTKECKGGHYL